MHFGSSLGIGGRHGKVDVRRSRRQHPELLFFVLYLVIGLSACLIMPLGAGSDEPNHIARVQQIASGVMLPQRVDAEKVAADYCDIQDAEEILYGGEVDEALVVMPVMNMRKLHTTHEAFTPEELFTPGPQETWGPDKGKLTIAFPNTSVYSPVCYVPHVLGYWIGAGLFHNAWWAIVCMRCIATIVLAAGIAICIRIIPYGKWSCAELAVLPVSLVTNCCVTADTMTFLCCLAFVAVVMRIEFGSHVKPGLWIALIVLGLLLGLVKMPYVLLVLLALLVLLRPDYRADWRVVCVVIATLLCSFTAFGLWYSAVQNVNTASIFSEKVAPAAQMSYVMGHPLEFGNMLWQLFISTDFFQIWYPEVFLERTISVPAIVVAAFLFALAADLATLRKHPAGRRPALVCSIVCVFVFVLAFCGVAMALYLQFSAVGASEISGVQSRYFIPVLPLVLLAILFLAMRMAPHERSKQKADLPQGDEVAELPYPVSAAFALVLLASISLFVLTTLSCWPLQLPA